MNNGAISSADVIIHEDWKKRSGPELKKPNSCLYRLGLTKDDALIVSHLSAAGGTMNSGGKISSLTGDNLVQVARSMQN